MKRERRTVYEDREIKRRQGLERHTVLCPHCSKPVLDHLTECPHCKGKLTPAGYRPPDPKTMKIVKIVTYTAGTLVAIGLFLYLILR